MGHVVGKLARLIEGAFDPPDHVVEGIDSSPISSALSTGGSLRERSSAVMLFAAATMSRTGLNERFHEEVTENEIRRMKQDTDGEKNRIVTLTRVVLTCLMDMPT